MTNDQRSEILEEAQTFATTGDYESSVGLLEAFLARHAQDIPARRYLANVLELRAFVATERRPKSLVTSADYLRARTIYDSILEERPNDILTLNDLGEHFHNLGAIDRAIRCYSRVFDLIVGGDKVIEWRGELSDIASRLVDEMKSGRNPDQAEALEGLHRRIIAVTA
jgi:tetratricopeptide (TPR) repeat protein